MKTSQTIENTTVVRSTECPADRVGDEGRAILSSRGNYTSFSYGDNVIRFMTSPALMRYEKVLKWDKGYLEVIANYNGREEEEYIDLLPILDNLLIDADSFLSPIKKVEVAYAGS